MASKKTETPSSPELPSAPELRAAAPPPAPPPSRDSGPDVNELMTDLIRAEDEDDGGKPRRMMTAGGAQLLVAYLVARRAKMPDDVVAFARQLRSGHPLCWKPLLAMNYIGFAHALMRCSLEPVSASALQDACSALAAA